MVHIGTLRKFLVPGVVPPLPGTPSPSCLGSLRVSGRHFLKVWWQYATLFVFIYLYTLDTFTHHSFINLR